ncbi:hypothetical protein ASF74_14875 [Arthrobacter sp. Leaf145]|nr:hypothetical protein ASF74_14875 [Arthrobacter sp. Leaf145]
MSAETLQGIHDAIAAHIADENEDATEYLTEWVVTAAAVVSDNAEVTSYWFLNAKDIPYHHRLGLLHRGLEYLQAD